MGDSNDSRSRSGFADKEAFDLIHETQARSQETKSLPRSEAQAKAQRRGETADRVQRHSLRQDVYFTTGQVGPPWGKVKGTRLTETVKKVAAF